MGTIIGIGNAIGAHKNTFLGQIDYSGIVSALNLLTDTLDTAYDGTNPTLTGMETELDIINGEIITA